MLEYSAPWTITIVLLVSVEIGIFYVILDNISVRKRNGTFIGIGLITLMVLGIGINILNIFPNTIVIVNMVIVAIFYKINYEVDIWNCTITIMICWFILSATESISMIIIAIVTSQNIGAVVYENPYKIITVALSKLFFIIIFIIYKNKTISVGLKKQDFNLIAVPILSNMLCLFIIFKFTFSITVKNSINNYMLLVITVIIILSNVAIIGMMKRLIKNNELKLENTLIKQKTMMDHENYIKLQKSYRNLRELQHDMKNHIVCIKELYGDENKAYDYIEKVNEEVENINIFNTGNSIIDIILSEKKRICTENNIEFNTQININKGIPIEVIDLSSIFSNALDNAIEACYKIKDGNIKRYVDIKNTYVGNFLVIRVDNSKVNSIKIHNNKIVTDKADGFEHGFGISSIRRCAEKYDGEVVVDYTKDRFILKIVIPI
ncbi:ATP-binding protein [Clostridium frigidicarnis]|uniref:GHKL domain-containing protein n=1 Tax=Clostridium frigidicarnis TaxID=84698 RepID=A0A1I0ZXS3_9CLOT|nr:ATP-binding protein [Clostridium frigidicarnis]SFB30564.1 GHKL domain-containing protein [Clostridium frigidicarnis]